MSSPADILLVQGDTKPSAPTAGKILFYSKSDNLFYSLDSAGNERQIGAGATGSGTVTSVAVSGGTTGLTTSGGPITIDGTITLAGTLNVANGGTGATTAEEGIKNLLPPYVAGKYLTTNGLVLSWDDPPSYILPVATNSVLGGVKIGTNIDVAVDGTISVQLATVAKTGAYSDLTGQPTALSQFTNDVGFITSTDLTWNNITGKPTFASVATTGDYDDLINSPVNVSYFTNDVGYYTDATAIPWTQITGKPTFATVATTGSYNDLINKPTIPTLLTQLSDVTITTPAAGQALTYDTVTSKWVNTTLSFATSLAQLTDVSIPAPIDGQVLTYDSATGKWIAQTQTGGIQKLEDIPNVYAPDPIAQNSLLQYDTVTSKWNAVTTLSGISFSGVSLDAGLY